MNVESLYDDPERRRWWLLCKALESTSFDEALKLVRAAEDFLAASDGATVELACGAQRIAPRTVDPVEGNLLRSDALPSVALKIPSESMTDTSRQQEIDPADKEPIAADTVGDEAASAPPSPVAAAFDGLVVMASPDDVVRYLRQRDDVVISSGEGTYLVNGRFRLCLDELVERANRMRNRQNLPIFSSPPSNLAPPQAQAAVNSHPIG